MTAHEIAVQIYNRLHANDEQAAKIGFVDPRPVYKASLEQIEAHIQNCQDAAREYGVFIDHEKIEFGKTREEIFAIGQHKKRQQSGRRGYNALKNKYGEDSAKRILDKAKKARR